MKIVEYLDERGRSPYREWINRLDSKSKARIQARIFRFESGNLGDYKPVGTGVFEARIFFGPGYRVYFGIEAKTIVILLVGGDKSTQRKDISRAQEIWGEYSGGKQ